MRPKIDYSLYLVADTALMSTDCSEDAVDLAITGGCTVVQLREKSCFSKSFYDLGRKIKEITDKHNIPLIINDRADIAVAIGADGVHVGQKDLPCAVARRIVGGNKIVGVSVNNLAEALSAQADGADYIGVGAVFTTGTKTDARPISREELIKITQRVSIPVVAIGGINENTVASLEGIDIDGIAVVSAIISRKDITASAANMKKLFQENKRRETKEIAAAIFDLDGTLLDSTGVWERIDVDFLKKRGLAVPPFFLETVAAFSFKEAARYTIELFGLNDTVEELTTEWNGMALDEYTNNIRLKAGAEKYLRGLKERGIRLAVATSLPKCLYEPVLKRNGVYDLFEFCCSVSEVDRGKEYSDVFEYAIKKLKLKPSRCMIFEDVLASVKAAKSTGAYVCGVYDEYSKKHWQEISVEADYCIVDFSALPANCPLSPIIE